MIRVRTICSVRHPSASKVRVIRCMSAIFLVCHRIVPSSTQRCYGTHRFPISERLKRPAVCRSARTCRSVDGPIDDVEAAEASPIDVIGSDSSVFSRQCRGEKRVGGSPRLFERFSRPHTTAGVWESVQRMSTTARHIQSRLSED